MGLLRKIGKAVGGLLPGTGRHAARRAERSANQYAAEAAAARADLERKTKKERSRAQKLAIRGLRSRRAASFFTPSTTEGGSSTIG